MITLLFDSRGPEVNSVCIAIQSQLSKIGMNIKLIINEDVNGFRKENPLGWNCSISLNGSLSGTGGYIEPLVRRFTSGGDWNFGGISDPRIDEIGEKIQKTFDLEEQYKLLRQAQDILVGEQVYILASTFKRFMVVASPTWKDYPVSSYRRHINYRTAP